MGMVYEGSSQTYNQVLESINLFFTIVFMLECAIKIIGLGIKGYWISGWNRFDFFVVMSSILDIILTAVGSSLAFLRVGP